MNVKQVIVIRTDLNMRKGKMCAQAAHASMKVLLDRGSTWYAKRTGEWDQEFSSEYDHSGDQEHAFIFKMDEAIRAWVEGLFTKVVVGVGSVGELHLLWEKAESAGLPCAIIQDAGNTEFHGVPTFTALAVGPAEASLVDAITGHLKLL